MTNNQSVDVSSGVDSTIEDVHELVSLLERFEKSARFSLVKLSIDLIKDHDDLLLVLPLLDDDDRAGLAELCMGVMKKGYELEATLKLLPETDRLALAKKGVGLITSFFRLDSLLLLLPNPSRLELVEQCWDEIISFPQLSYLLVCLLPGQARLRVAMQKADLFIGTVINEDECLQDVFDLSVSFEERVALCAEEFEHYAELLLKGDSDQAKFSALLIKKLREHPDRCEWERSCSDIEPLGDTEWFEVMKACIASREKRAAEIVVAELNQVCPENKDVFSLILNQVSFFSVDKLQKKPDEPVVSQCAEMKR